MLDSFHTHNTFQECQLADLNHAEKKLPGLERAPVALRIIVENMLRHEDQQAITAEDIRRVVDYSQNWQGEVEIAYYPSRLVMQDYSGMPALIDLAALRARAHALGLDPAAINPQVPSELIIDHSLMAHIARRPSALRDNLALEFSQNKERFTFLKWAQNAFDGLHVIPPGRGIIHQINIEYLADVVTHRMNNSKPWLMPDTVIGTDSHTTMVNGLGVLGWGVGGIEAEAVMLGEPISMLVPPVIGIRLLGEIPPGVLATDIVLTLTQILRKKGVVGAILEFYGPGVASLPVTDRVTIANMSPEFGSICAFFAPDEHTMEYLYATGRSKEHVERAKAYLQHNRLWFDPRSTPSFADSVDFDLSSVRRVVAGPKRPEERRDLSEVPAATQDLINTSDIDKRVSGPLKHGDIVIAALTSCTNTSNPAAMISAGLVARNARARGLQVPAHVKTSLAPGSQVVIDYLDKLGLKADLEALGFYTVGFGCTTCVGNSGDLDSAITAQIDSDDLCVASVLSGNRNFEGRIHAKVKANYLASPPLVIAYALAGTVMKNLSMDPIANDKNGQAVYLQDLWPEPKEIADAITNALDRQQYIDCYAEIFKGSPDWEALEVNHNSLFKWGDESTYVRLPPFFDNTLFFEPHQPLIDSARPLLILGDSVTTDHISPVGGIAVDSPAGRYLSDSGLKKGEFNAYGARRGNHDVMVRGTYANNRLKNAMVAREGGYTKVMPDNVEASVFDASQAYIRRDQQMVVVAGRMYGAGSARDWAAKGTALLGVRAIIAQGFERIHRSNLVRMGILPLELTNQKTDVREEFDATDQFSLTAEIQNLTPRQNLILHRHRSDGSIDDIDVIARVDTLEELLYLKAGGILPYVANKLLNSAGNLVDH